MYTLGLDYRMSENYGCESLDLEDPVLTSLRNLWHPALPAFVASWFPQLHEGTTPLFSTS